MNLTCIVAKSFATSPWINTSTAKLCCVLEEKVAVKKQKHQVCVEVEEARPALSREADCDCCDSSIVEAWWWCLPVGGRVLVVVQNLGRQGFEEARR